MFSALFKSVLKSNFVVDDFCGIILNLMLVILCDVTMKPCRLQHGLKIKIRTPKQGELENQDRDLKMKITFTYYTAY